LYISYYHDVAAGGTIVLVSTAGFALAWLFAPDHGFVTSRLLRRVAPIAAPEAQILVESPEIRSHQG
jgi:manganese/iron transport system permease protein